MRLLLLRRFFLVFICSIFLSMAVVAEDEEAEETPVSKYMEVEPAFVTNFGNADRLRYMKVQVTLRVTGAEGEAQVNHHLPVIKDTLLNLFAIQSMQSIGSSEGKEKLRQDALVKVGAALTQEDENSFIEDLLFTSFVAHQ